MISGFETGGSSEYTAASGLSIVNEGDYQFVSPRHASITALGYVYWDVTEGTDGGSMCFSLNVRVTTDMYVDATVTRGGDTYKIRVSPSAGHYYKNVRLYGPSGYDSGIMPVFLTPGSWANIVIRIGYKFFGGYINGWCARRTTTAWTSSYGTVTRYRVDAPDVDIKIDDVCTWQGYYPGHLAIVQPFTPWVNRHIELEPSSDYDNYSCVDEVPTDDDTSYVYNSNSTKYDFYGCRLHSGPEGWTLFQVIGMRTHLRCRTDTDTGDEVCYAGIMANGSTTPFWTSSHNLSTGYATWNDYWGYAGDEGSFKPEWFDRLDAKSMQLGVKMTCGSGEQTRCTTLMAQVLCIYAVLPEASSSIVLTGCFDVVFDMSTTGWSDGDTVTFYTNIAGIPVGAINNGNDPQIAIIFSYQTATPAGIYVALSTYPTSLICTEKALIRSSTGAMRIRIIMHDNFCTVLNSDQYVYTFAIKDANYPSTLELWAKTNRTSQSITNVLVSELADWREGIYIDMETSIMSGINSIIQERPIEIIPLEGGIVDFSYNRLRSTVTPSNIYKHSVTEAIATAAGSHYIIYYSDVAMLVDETFMDESGYLSRVLQMSQLDSGAVNASKIIAQRTRESQEQHLVEMAPDIQIEPGDKATISYTISGTGTVVSKNIIVEQVQLHIAEGEYSMQIGGRKYV